MKIKDKEGYIYTLWEPNLRAVLKLNKVNCNDVLCDKWMEDNICEKCVFSLKVNDSYDRDLADFEIFE